MLRRLGNGLLAVGLVLGVASNAAAETLVKFALSESGPDVAFDGTEFRTVNDGNAGTSGDQNTYLDFVGALDSIVDYVAADASLTVEGITAAGAPTSVGAIITQATQGGIFRVYDPSNVLLLEGALTDGVIAGSSSASTGSFFSTAVGSFTGGTLASLLDPNTAELSLALASIVSEGGLIGLRINNGALAPFTADSTGLIVGQEIPEPITGALLLSGLAAGAAVRRRKS